MTYQRLEFLAGYRALETIRAQGLGADDVKVVAGAAGGPKWLILGQLDRLLFGSWWRERRQPLFLIGSSIGSWRFAAASRLDPVGAIDCMEQVYIHQAYDHKPSPREISVKSAAVLDQVIGDRGAEEVLNHPVNRISLLAVRGRHLLACRRRFPLALGLAAAIATNAMTRHALKYFFQQTLFADPRSRPPFSAMGRAPNAMCALTPANLKPALSASGSIPYVMEGVSAVPGAPPGVYRDGGVVDYHLDLPFGLNGKGIVLFPHFSRRIIPGWFDKRLAWRGPDAENFADVLVVAPSRAFVAGLPNGRITDRKDFYRYAGNDEARFACWRQVADAGRMLADDFIEAVVSGKIRHLVKPLKTNVNPAASSTIP